LLAIGTKFTGWLAAPLVQYVLLALTWGASFLFIKVGLQGLSAGQLVLGRLSCGAAALATISVATRQRLPHQPAVWAHLAVVAALLCVAPFLLFAWSERFVPSGLASIYNATTPLMTTLVALVALPAERPTPRKLVGLGCGFLGVLIVLGPWRGLGTAGGAAQLGCLAAAFSYGLAFVYLRRFVTHRGLAPVPIATVQVSLGALFMLLLAPAYLHTPVHLSWSVVASVLVLGTAGTGLAYVWNTRLVSAWGATNAATVTYLTPVVGVMLGVALLGETLAWNEPVGALTVIIGIATAQGRFRAPEGLSRFSSTVPAPWLNK
jgi:drug/metabolite transporter (DMT)-like permease